MAELKKVDGTGSPETNFSKLLEAAFSNGTQDAFSGFFALTEKLKAKYDELGIMERDTMVAAIVSDYMSDTLLPNSNGDLVSIVAKNPENQSILESIYRRLNLPLDKIVYSLITKAKVVGEFEQVSVVDLAKRTISERAATESADGEINQGTDEADDIPSGLTIKSATEQVLIRKPGTILPNVSIVSEPYTVFPIIKYERCIGYIEVKKELVESEDFDWTSDIVSYKDVIIHPAMDYVHEIYGVRHGTKPLRLRVRAKDGQILTYDLAEGCSMLEDSYSAWKTLVLLQDSIVLASLIKNAQIMLVEVEAGGATDAQIQAERIRLRSLFEGQLAMGSNGMRSYLNPQSKPAYIYSFTNNGVGKITASVIGGEYNPGQLYYLTPFVNQFFSGMNYPKQRAGFTEGAGGLDGGGAVEEYTKRYNSTVARLKRLLGSFIKKCINNVLAAKNLYKLVDEFDVRVYGAYSEEGLQEVQFQQAKLSLYESLISFTGIKDEQKQNRLRSLLIKNIITTKSITEEIDRLILEEERANKEEEAPVGTSSPELGEDTQIPDDLLSELGIEEEGKTQEEAEPQLEEEPISAELPDMEDTLGSTGE